MSVATPAAPCSPALASRQPEVQVMNRRAFVIGLAAALVAPVAARAPQTGKVWRLGFISVASMKIDVQRVFAAIARERPMRCCRSAIA